MDARGRAVHPLLILALVLVAAAGYLVGHRRSSTPASGERAASATRSLSSSGLLLEYPSGWERTATNASIPGLALTAPVTLQPHGNPGVGLLTGQLPAGEPSPLPARFLAGLHGLPHVEVVDLLSNQAYRYSQLAVPGYVNALDLYVIPATGQGPRVMACFARERLSAASRQCERIVSGVALTGPSPTTLTPEPNYARGLSAVVTSLDAERLRERKQMGSGKTTALLATAASRLAKQFSSAAASLAALEIPQLVALAGATLASAVRHAGAAYSALAAAAREETVAGYDAARSAVARAEASVDSALADLALYGYGST